MVHKIITIFVLFVFVVASCVSAQTVKLTDITFGLTASYSGGVWEPGPRFTAGLLAAFKEANDAGGVRGRYRILLKYLDDQYDADKVQTNLATLFSSPEIFMVLGTLGTPTTAGAISKFESENNIALGPLTGGAQFRTTFQPYLVHVRAGYNDEAIAMLQYLVMTRHMTRLSMVYQDDAFGIPPRDIVREGLAELGLKLLREVSYDKTKTGSLDFEADARLLLSDNPQAIIMYAVGAYANPFYLQVDKVARASSTIITPPLFITGSWMGDTSKDYIQTQGIGSTIDLYMTQVVPHPEDMTSVAADKYRAALRAHEGASAALYDFLSFEGYLVGRFTADILRHVVADTPSREAFKETVFGTRMFRIDDLLLGPYNDNCDFGTEAKGRSAMCNCTQGLRMVSLVHVDAATFRYLPVTSSTYSMLECYSTTAVLKRPLLFRVPPNTSEVTTGQLSIGARGAIGSMAEIVQTASDLVVVAVQWAQLSWHEPEIDGMARFVGLTSDVVPSTNNTHLFIVPTMLQELHSVASRLGSKAPSGSSLSVKFITLRSDLLSLETPFLDSLTTFTHAKSVTFKLSSAYVADAAHLASAISAGSAHFIAGLQTEAELSAVLNALRDVLLSTPSSAATTTAFIPFNELARVWSAVDDCAIDVACRPALALLQVNSNIPHWTTPEGVDAVSPFVQLYHESLVGSTAATLRHPLSVLGFLMGKFVAQVNSFGGNSLLDKLYTLRVSAIGDVTLGPFNNGEDCPPTAAASGSCLCNVGPRMLYTFPAELLFSPPNNVGNVTTVHTYTFSSCTVTYDFPVIATTSSLGIILAIVCPIAVVGIVGGVMGHFLVKSHLARKKVEHAPKNTSDPFATMIIALKKESSLWERYPSTMPKVLQTYNKVITQCVKQHAVYEVKTIGTGGVLVVAKRGEDLVKFAADLAEGLETPQWDTLLGVVTTTNRKSCTTTIRSSCHSELSEEDIKTPLTINSGNSTDRKSIVSRAQSFASARSSLASSAAHRRNQVLRVEFGIGMHSGHGRVTYDETRNHYDYAGPTVDIAAILADRAHGGQLLCSEHFVAESHIAAEELSTFGDFEMGGDKPLRMIQYNPPTLPRRYFEFRADVEEGVDSIVATLQQQSSGLMKKRVTALVLYVHNEDYYANNSLEDIHKALDPVVQSIHKAVHTARGAVVSFVSGRLVVVFNAKTPASQAALRSYQLSKDIKAIIDEAFPNTRITAGIHTKEGIVGTKEVTLGPKEKLSQEILLSEVVDVATGLQRYCAQYHRDHCWILVGSNVAQELQTDVELEVVDIARIVPMSYVKSGRVVSIQDVKPTTLFCVRSEREATEGDEWLYELEKKDEANKFDMGNALFDVLLQGSISNGSEGTQNLKSEVDGLIADTPGLSECYGVGVLSSILANHDTLNSYVDTRVVI